MTRQSTYMQIMSGKSSSRHVCGVELQCEADEELALQWSLAHLMSTVRQHACSSVLASIRPSCGGWGWGGGGGEVGVVRGGCGLL